MVKLMLYKKVHRQYLRQFRVGRRFKFCGRSNVIYSGTRVVNKLFIGKRYICIRIDYDLGYTWVISMQGRIMDNIEWLD